MDEARDPKLIAEELCRYARANLLQEGTNLDENTQLAEVGLDSFSLVELLLFAERRFGVSVPGSHLTRENVASLFSLTQCISRLGGQVSPPA